MTGTVSTELAVILFALCGAALAFLRIRKLAEERRCLVASRLQDKTNTN